MNKSNTKAFIDANNFDEDGISILPSTRELDDTLEEAYISMPSNVFIMSQGLPLTAYTMGDTENVEGAEKINTPSLEAISGRTTRIYVPTSRNEPISSYTSPTFMETSNTPKITNYKELKQALQNPKRSTTESADSEHEHLGVVSKRNLSSSSENINTIISKHQQVDKHINKIHHTWANELIETVSQSPAALQQLHRESSEKHKPSSETEHQKLQKQRDTFKSFVDDEENKVLIEQIQNIIDSQVKMSEEEALEERSFEAANTQQNTNTEEIINQLRYEFNTKLEVMTDRWTEQMAQQGRQIEEQTRKDFQEMFLRFLNS